MNFYLTNIFNPYYFIYGLSIGLILVLLLKPKPKILIQYPTPFNANKTIYKDNLNQSYKLKAIRTQCSNNNKVINPQF
jgi:hypothetical protein